MLNKHELLLLTTRENPPELRNFWTERGKMGNDDNNPDDLEIKILITCLREMKLFSSLILISFSSVPLLYLLRATEELLNIQETR